MKKLRDLGNRENRNILELKIDEIIINNLFKILQEGVILLKALNSLSPRSSSFLNPALLGFSDKNVKVPQDNS
jgi:hypothetical protein